MAFLSNAPLTYRRCAICCGLFCLDGGEFYLMHWGRDKMAAIITDDIFKYIFFENICISIKCSLKFVPMGPIKNIAARIGWDNGLAPTRRQAIIWTSE